MILTMVKPGQIIGIVILITIILIFYCKNVSKVNDFLTGTWTGTENFHNAADMDSMVLRIGEPSNPLTNNRRIYIMIIKDGEVIYGRVTEATIHTLPHKYELVLSENPDDDDDAITSTKLTDFIPSTHNLVFNIATGKMQWFNDDLLYFEGTKEHVD